MRIISFIEEAAVIKRILRHLPAPRPSRQAGLGVWQVAARTPRAPPASPAEMTFDYSVADAPASYD